MKEKRVAVVAGGSIDLHFLREELIGSGYSFIIGVDKGIEYLIEPGIQPDLMIGDFDSVEAGALDLYRKRGIPEIKLNPMKDDTDLEAALRESIERFPGAPVTVYGATGTRLDHLLANVDLLHTGLTNDVDIVLLDPYNRVRMLPPGHEFVIKRSEQYGRYVSLICYTERVTGLTLRGMKYPLDHIVAEKGSTLCISNEIEDEAAFISFEEGVMILVESRE